ncbi:hypothetical protein [Mycobacterium sp. 050134]|uniref:hypothetical protein n=1 Tax=Mycobacterium sp. 050134 TaxID=3096111 RepID=UPI002EDA3CB3
MTATSSVADQLQAAARVARSGASDIYAARSRLRYAVADAHSAGFEVGEGLSVTDRTISGSSAQGAARQAEARALAGNIRQRAAQLAGLDQQVAGNITAAVAGIRDTFPTDQTAGGQSTENHVRAVDNHTFKEDPPPQPPMSREQAAAGLRDVNQRIWEHNHIDKPFVESLPPNDPRRAEFHAETEQLNAEKRAYLDVLPPQRPPPHVTGPGEVNLPGVPPGLMSETPAKSGQGWIYPIAPNQLGIDSRVVSIRVMEPTSQYPNGYLNYLNVMGQEVDPFSGRTLPATDPFAHIPLPK